MLRKRSRITEFLFKINYRVVNRLSSRKLLFFSTSQFISLILDAYSVIPQNIDVVCAILRTGFIPASILSQKLDVPLTSFDLLIKKLAWFRGVEKLESVNPESILLVDDAVGSGESMDKAYALLKQSFPILSENRIQHSG